MVCGHITPVICQRKLNAFNLKRKKLKFNMHLIPVVVIIFAILWRSIANAYCHLQSLISCKDQKLKEVREVVPREPENDNNNAVEDKKENVAEEKKIVPSKKYKPPFLTPCLPKFLNNVTLPEVDLVTEKDLRSPLVLAVDATPNVYSGYLVNLRTKTCKFYCIGRKTFPWEMEMSKEPSEFEMKNLLFALLLWESTIIKYSKVHVYTDNGAINRPDCRFGSVALKFLEHLAGCKSIVRVNSNVHINSKFDLKNFTRFIQPADDLSRWQISSFKKRIKNNFGITKISGTHYTEPDAVEINSKPHYSRTNDYWQIVQMGRDSVNKWKSPCSICKLGFTFPNCAESSSCDSNWRTAANASRSRKSSKFIKV